MPWSSSNQYRQKIPHLTTTSCSRALGDFFQAPTDLAVATEASSHPSGLISLYAQPYVYAGGGLGNVAECPLQVCLAGGTRRDSLTFASACVPKQCDAMDLAADDFVEKLHLASEGSVDPVLAREYHALHERIAELNNFLNTGWTCGEYSVPFNIFPFGGIYILVSMILVSFVLVATYFRGRLKCRRNLHIGEPFGDDHFEFQEEKKESFPEVASDPPTAKPGLWTDIISCWNANANVQKLFERRASTASLDGLRVGSILWVMLGHVMAIQSSSGGGYSNPKSFLPPHGITTRLLGQLLFASRFAVDTFLFISGLLIVRVLCAKMPAKDGHHFGKRYLQSIPGLLLHRLLRILPLYVMCLGFWTQVAPQLGGGPFWYQWEEFLSPCRRFGWTNLLFVNNFFPWNMPNVETCFYHSWYLALDLQLFIFAPFLVFWYQYRPRAGMLATGILMSLSIGATISLAHWRKWSINTFDGAAVARFDVEGYAKPHIRCQTYLAGMLLGMILQQQTSSLRQTIQTRLSMMFAVGLLAFVTFITVTGAYSRRACNFEEWPELDNCGSLWSPNQTFLYAASSRALWALAIGIICFLCLQGAGGMVNALLSHPAWTPLSHLSFGAYLLHPIVIFVYQFGDRQKEPFRLLSFSLDYLSLSVVSFFLALAFALVVELPIANLSKRLYPTRRDPGERWRTESEVLLSSVNLNGHRYGSFVHPPNPNHS